MKPDSSPVCCRPWATTSHWLTGFAVWIWLGAGSGGWLAQPQVRGADALFYGVIKSHQYEQHPGTPPQLLSTGAFAFNAFVICTTNGSVTEATVTVPGESTPRGLKPETNAIAWRLEQKFDRASDLDDTFPSSGSLFNPSVYAVAMVGRDDGPRSGQVSYWLVSAPRTPELVNLDQAQGLDSTQDFTLEWKPLGGTALDLLQVVITDPSSNLFFASPLPFTEGALDGRAVSVTIPGGTLPAGADLVGHVALGRTGLPNTNGVPGAVGVAALLRDTSFALTTLPAVPPRLLRPEAINGRFRFWVEGESNRTYEVQGTAPNDRWSTLLHTNWASGRGWVEVHTSAQPHRAYRLRVGP